MLHKDESSRIFYENPLKLQSSIIFCPWCQPRVIMVQINYKLQSSDNDFDDQNAAALQLVQIN